MKDKCSHAGTEQGDGDRKAGRRRLSDCVAEKAPDQDRDQYRRAEHCKHMLQAKNQHLRDAQLAGIAYYAFIFIHTLLSFMS